MNAIELGATLYVPANRDAVLVMAYGANPDLRSMVICLEDSIPHNQIIAAEVALASALASFLEKAPSVRVYIRPRDLAMLSRILAMPGVETIEGFVLPKVTTNNVETWMLCLANSPHSVMPTIEGPEAFDRAALADLRTRLHRHQNRITAIRIGGNDILNLIGVRRSRQRTAYDGPLGNVIRDIATTFLPYGIPVSAPVFEHYGSLELLREEVELDIEHGLFTKTAIHPMQITAIQSLYKPKLTDLSEAKAILDRDAAAVFGRNGSMCEPATHKRWAQATVERARIYGVSNHVRDAQGLVA